jgi:hypothetical protein
MMILITLEHYSFSEKERKLHYDPVQPYAKKVLRAYYTPEERLGIEDETGIHRAGRLDLESLPSV